MTQLSTFVPLFSSNPLSLSSTQTHTHTYKYNMLGLSHAHGVARRQAADTNTQPHTSISSYLVTRGKYSLSLSFMQDTSDHSPSSSLSGTTTGASISALACNQESARYSSIQSTSHRVSFHFYSSCPRLYSRFPLHYIYVYWQLVRSPILYHTITVIALSFSSSNSVAIISLDVYYSIYFASQSIGCILYYLFLLLCLHIWSWFNFLLKFTGDRPVDYW